jgi:hypothetical protein
LLIAETNIAKLPNELYVGINLFIYNTPLAKKYTDEEIRKMVDFIDFTIFGQIIS